MDLLLVGIASWSLTATLAGILGVAGMLKLLNRASFRAAVASWGLPAPLQAATRIALPWVELGIAVGSICATATGQGVMISHAAMVALFSVFLGVQAVLLARGTEATCGCVADASTLGRKSMSRSGVLLGLSIIAVAGVLIP